MLSKQHTSELPHPNARPCIRSVQVLRRPITSNAGVDELPPQALNRPQQDTGTLQISLGPPGNYQAI